MATAQTRGDPPTTGQPPGTSGTTLFWSSMPYWSGWFWRNPKKKPKDIVDEYLFKAIKDVEKLEHKAEIPRFVEGFVNTCDSQSLWIEPNANYDRRPAPTLFLKKVLWGDCHIWKLVSLLF